MIIKQFIFSWAILSYNHRLRTAIIGAIMSIGGTAVLLIRTAQGANMVTDLGLGLTLMLVGVGIMLVMSVAFNFIIGLDESTRIPNVTEPHGKGDRTKRNKSSRRKRAARKKRR